MFQVKISTAFAAFEENQGLELARILRELATSVEELSWEGEAPMEGHGLQDINGNRVGHWELDED